MDEERFHIPGIHNSSGYGLNQSIPPEEVSACAVFKDCSDVPCWKTTEKL